MNHILSVEQFTPDFLEHLFSKADHFSQQRILPASLAGKVITNLFYEPSTRTSSSFYSAGVRLGAHVIPINEVNYSSVAKGESFEDTIKTMSCYSDLIVLRHPEAGAARRAAEVSPVPIINAGDGENEHPTQALLDLYTIRKEQYRLSNLTVGMMGDLTRGRTVHSLSKLLRNYSIDQIFIAPKKFQMPKELIHQGDATADAPLKTILESLDILYVTRLQKERILGGENLLDYNYGITKETLKNLKSTCAIMHPFPRVGEIAEDIDRDPRAAYFRQMENGLWIRAALLDYIFSLGNK
mgnify:CR=1 FL=1